MTDFRRDSHEWDEMVKRLNEDFLVDLKCESRRCANPGPLKGKDEAEVKACIAEVKEALKNEDLQQDLDLRALDSDLADEFTEGPLPLQIWDVEGVGAKKRLVVTTNQDHPIYAAFVDSDFLLWVKHNLAEAVAEFFTQSTGKTEAMLLVKSDILKHIGKCALRFLTNQLTHSRGRRGRKRALWRCSLERAVYRT